MRSCLDLHTSRTTTPQQLTDPPHLRTSSPHSPPPPRPARSLVTSPASSSTCQSPVVTDAQDTELRTKTGAHHLSRKASFRFTYLYNIICILITQFLYRSSMPVAMGKPPLPASALPKSPTDLLHLGQKAAITTEPGAGAKSRLTQLGVPEGKNYESLKSQTSTASHGSTGSKMSSTSSQMSAQV